MFSESQLARALIAAESAGIPTTIVLNKTDLPTLAAARERLAPYAAMGVPVLELSLKQQGEAASAALLPLLAGKATLVLGPSGMGKSTLINLMVPAAAAQVGEISQALNAGRHTTTSTSWYWLDDARRAAR
jgi:ribosome biogenesis GTPase